MITKYKCTKCGAEDSDRTNDPPLALICWNCRAGRVNSEGRLTTPMEQVQLRIGMLRKEASK